MKKAVAWLAAAFLLSEAVLVHLAVICVAGFIIVTFGPAAWETMRALRADFHNRAQAVTQHLRSKAGA